MKRFIVLLLGVLALCRESSAVYAQTDSGSGEATAAVWIISQTGDNLLLKADGTAYYLNAYFGDGGIVLHSGTGDASQWRIVEKETSASVTVPQEGVEYYLRSQMEMKLNQYLTYIASETVKPLQLREESGEAAVFTFKASGSGYKLYNVSAGGYVQPAAYHVCLTVGAPSIEDDDEPVVLGSGYYQINRNNNASMFLMHADDGSLKYAAADNALRCFWQFEPSGREGCYYVKNATSGQYLQSTRMPGRNGRVTLGVDPVEYKIGRDAGATSATRGFYYLCSTDQTVDATTNGTLGLNAQPGTGNVVCYDICASSSANSYWALTEVDYTYEVPLLSAAPDWEHAGEALRYRLTASDGRCLAWDEAGGALSLSAKANTDAQGWFFVGRTNEREGYCIVNLSQPGATLNCDAEGHVSLGVSDTPTRWYAEAQEMDGEPRLSFVPYDRKAEEGGRLTADGETAFMLGNYRSAYSLGAQIYFLPCGTQTSVYLSGASVTGEAVQKELQYRASARPASYYTLFTDDKATVSRGCRFRLNLSLSAQADGLQAFVYFDWNADGEFETSYTCNGEDMDIEVPETAKTGRTRMRVRLTDNGLTDAEDDAVGAIYDFILRVEEPMTERIVRVSVNGEGRGSAYIVSGEEMLTECASAYGEEVTVKAEPKGNAVFNGWRDGKTVVSTSAEYTFNVTEHTELCALFSPNTQVAVGVCRVVSDAPSRFVLEQEGRTVRVRCADGFLGAEVYAADGTRVYGTSDETLSLETLSRGNYIVKVRTAAGTESAKIILP